MAAELVETSRLWGRVAAQVEPEWVEPLAAHLVTRTYSEPHWSARRGAVMAYERVTLYGLPLVAQRRVSYARDRPGAVPRAVHPARAGRGRVDHAPPLRPGQRAQLVEEVERLEARARRRDLLVDDEALFDFYDARVPADVVSQRHFDRWWKRARRSSPDLLTFTTRCCCGRSPRRLSRRCVPVDLARPATWRCR